jgi:hypothetical protein
MPLNTPANRKRKHARTTAPAPGETYQFRQTYHGNKKVSAKTVAAELTRIRAASPLTAQGVVDAARPTDAPLHPAFEWDNIVAAEAFRLEQARSLIRSIEVVQAATPEHPREVYPVYVHVPAHETHKPGTYVPSAVLVHNIDEAQRALREALYNVEGAQRLVLHIQKLMGEAQPSVVAQLSVASQGLQLIRQALEGLKAA